LAASAAQACGAVSGLDWQEKRETLTVRKR